MRRSTLALALITTVITSTQLHAQQYVLGPDSKPQPGVPHGTVAGHELKPGTLYPGTPHTYSLYLPAGYDASKPAPFMIFLDGSGFLRDTNPAPIVLDNLIARHDLPPLTAIFIEPGVLPALSEQAQNRFQRIFEYDSLSHRFSPFPLTELLPHT